MTEQNRPLEFDHLEPPLASAVRAVLEEPLSETGIERVESNALQLDEPINPPRPQDKTPVKRPSRFIRYGSLAAVVLVAGLLGLSLLGRGDQAFADALQNVKELKTAKFNVVSRFGMQPPQKQTMYCDTHRLRVEVGEDPASMIMIADLKQKQALYLVPLSKKAEFVEVNENFPEQFMNPLEQLRQMRPKDAESLGEEYLDQKLARVYRISKFNFFGRSGEGEMMVWIDPETELPLKIVIEDRKPQSAMEIHFENFEWNQPIANELFSMTIPEGYQRGDVLPKPRSRESFQPPKMADIPPPQLDKGILSSDRVPARIVWGPDGGTITALLREPESVGPARRKSHELRQWDVITGKLNWSVDVKNASNLGTSPDSLATAYIGGEVQLRDWETGAVTKKWTSEKNLLPLAFSPDGKTLAGGIAQWRNQKNGSSPAGGVQLWDVAEAKLKQSTTDEHPTTFVSFTPDGRYVAGTSNVGTIRIWDVETGKLARIFPECGRCAFTSDSQRIACPAIPQKPGIGGKADDVKIYDLASGRLLRTLSSGGHTKESYTLWIAFSPDDRYVATANWDGSVKLWETNGGQLIHTIDEHTGGVHTCVFSPDGKQLATGGEDKQLRLWDVDKLVAP